MTCPECEDTGIVEQSVGHGDDLLSDDIRVRVGDIVETPCPMCDPDDQP